MEENFKAQDREKILAYLEKNGKVSVAQLMEECGAEKLRVHPILFELVQAGQVCVVSESEMGAPEVVELKK